MKRIIAILAIACFFAAPVMADELEFLQKRLAVHESAKSAIRADILRLDGQAKLTDMHIKQLLVEIKAIEEKADENKPEEKTE